MSISRYSGAYRIGRHLNRHRLVVLTYHKVLADSLRPRFPVRPETILFASEFERHVAYLRRNYSVLSGEEFHAVMSNGRSFPAHSALITFDDGYENNYLHAFPILRRHGTTAMFFLTTDFVGHKDSFLWFDKLDALVDALPKAVLGSWADQRGLSPGVDTPDRIRASVKRLDRRERERVLLDLEQLAGRNVDRRLDRIVAGPMSWEQTREMAAHGMTFGSHTASHQILASAADDVVRMELATSRHEIEARLGRPCWSFTYPNGAASDFRPTDMAAAQDAGYKYAFSQVPGFVDLNSDRYAMHRMPIPASGNLNALLSRISGVHSALRRV